MRFDLVIRGGRVYDGTGMPGWDADLGIRDGRIVAIGRVTGTAGRTLDARGLSVTPGFIDVHTHYDVQLDWDPLATPSCWHGTTTVLAGNCGFGLAPAKPADVDWLAGMLSRVEGMSRAALRAGLRFRGGSFGDYWKRFDGTLGVNVGSYVGHSAVRRFVMGDAASERRATPAEIAAMQEVVRAAMREGAIGFSTSQLDIHVGEDGREVPSNHAGPDEIVALSAVLAEFGRGALEIIPRSIAAGYDAADRALILDMYRASGRPVELNLLLPTPDNPMCWEATLGFVREATAQGARLHPQFATNELGLHLRLADTFVFDEMPAWRAALTLPQAERLAALRDPLVRARLAAEFDAPGRAAGFTWDVLEVEAVGDPAHAGWVGRSVVELAAARGVTSLDAFLDCSLAEDLGVQWQTRLEDMAKAFIAHVVRAGIAEPCVMAGSSDGGAHLASFVGADYTTRLLTDWVPDALSFEQAIWRLAGMPATVHGLAGRGFLREGAWADVLLIDRSRLRAGHARLARDFPAGSERYVVDAEGYAAVIVNGGVVLENGTPTGALPGHVLRGA
ncbi:MAG: amidohydrolase family protein [bacterium]|nr:amidohydrolase family protein [bacterium]